MNPWKDSAQGGAGAQHIWGTRMRLISTYNRIDNPFNTYIQDAREGRKDYSLRRITLDEAISEGLYHCICTVTG